LKLKTSPFVITVTKETILDATSPSDNVYGDVFNHSGVQVATNFKLQMNLLVICIFAQFCQCRLSLWRSGTRV